jgi:hypothetical protein
MEVGGTHKATLIPLENQALSDDIEKPKEPNANIPQQLCCFGATIAVLETNARTSSNRRS